MNASARLFRRCITRRTIYDAPSKRHHSFLSTNTHRRSQLSSSAFLNRQNTRQRQDHVSQRNLSDNLPGHSPTARSVPAPSQQASPGDTAPTNRNKGPLLGVDAKTGEGGVWAQTSSKREKLQELLTELNAEGADTRTRGMETLDEAATFEQKLDLELADGLKIIARLADDGMDSVQKDDGPSIAAFATTTKEAQEATEQLSQLLNLESAAEEWDRAEFDATMNEAIRLLTRVLPPSDPKSPAGSLDVTSPLCYLREFVEYDTAGDVGEDDRDHSTLPDENVEKIQKLNDMVAQAYTLSTTLYRTLLIRAAAQTLLDNWDTITTVTSGDVDRAAVNKVIIPPQRATVKAQSVIKILDSYANGAGPDFVPAWWNLMDHDADGLIDETEMNSCVEMSMRPVHDALAEMVTLSLVTCPARTVGLGDDANDLSSIDTTFLSNPSAASNVDKKKLSWRHRRAELQARSLLFKTFRATLTHHFRDHVETPHRLRCIYAWAEKTHQNNKIDSIHVDASEAWGAASSVVGRQRYVELVPKISYAEFREEQAQHFPHLDKIGEEIATSFKEDLWVLQGKQRQNKELRRDCFYFLLGVSCVDIAISIL